MNLNLENEGKWTEMFPYDTHIAKRIVSPPVFIKNQVILQQTVVVYLGIHLNCRPTWNSHIDSKLSQIRLINTD